MSGLERMIERGLERWSAPACFGTPELAQAARYSLFSGGQRLRPRLVLLAARACGGRPAAALPAACAFEMVHTYSLIHDDLPAMDDDDLRRGRPSSHKAFGEALAILAGDALLTRAFGVLAESGLSAARRSELVRLLAQAAGGPGMVGGQVLDIQGGAPIERVHAMKTAALFAAAAEAGALAAGAPAARRRALRDYGRALGLAFQISDDILDQAGDGRRGGPSFPAAHGLARARAEARRRTQEALRALAGLGAAAAPLRRLARELGERALQGAT